MSYRKLLVAAGVLAAVSFGRAASAAPVLPDFTLDLNPVSIPITTQTLLVADKFVGNYNEIFSVTSFNPMTGAGTFSTLAYWDMGQIVHDDGTIVYPAGVSKLGVDYAVYGLFSASGSFGPNGLGGTTFTANAGDIEVVLDQNINTTKTLPGAAAGTPPPLVAPPNIPAGTPLGFIGAGGVALAGTGDDTVLATAALSAGEGHTAAGLANGDFGLVFNPFTLTGLGNQFFFAPKPFYLEVDLKGQFNSFVVAGGLNQTINGSADAFFNDTTVPEPATLTLLGGGLLAMAARRRKAKK